MATIAALQRGGVEPDIWKIEGLDTTVACEQVVAQALGRTLWEDALRKYLAGRASHDEAVYEISSRYTDVINAYRRAEPAFERGRE